MSENARLAFVLCEFDGISAHEAAKILQTNESAVWKRVSDDRRALLKATEGSPKASSLNLLDPTTTVLAWAVQS